MITMPEITSMQQPDIAAGADTQSNTGSGKSEFSSMVEKFSSNNTEKAKTGTKAEDPRPVEGGRQAEKENPDNGTNTEVKTDKAINNENISAETQVEEETPALTYENNDNKLETLLEVLKGMSQEAENKCLNENICLTEQNISPVQDESVKDVNLQDINAAVPVAESSELQEQIIIKTNTETVTPLAGSAKTLQKNLQTDNQEHTEAIPEGNALKLQEQTRESETEINTLQQFANTEEPEETAANSQKNINVNENENNSNLNNSNKNIKETDIKSKTDEAKINVLPESISVKDSGEQKKDISELPAGSEDGKAAVSRKTDEAGNTLLNNGREDQNNAMSDNFRNIRTITESSGNEATENAVRHGMVLKNTEKVELKTSETGSDKDVAGLTGINKVTGEGLKTAESVLSQNSSRHAVINELMDRAVFTVKGNNRLGVAVEHETLGKLNIKLSLEKGVVNVQIDAVDRGVRELVENNIQQIIESLSKSGINIGDFSVALKNQRNNSENWNRKSMDLNSNKDRAYAEPVQRATTNNGIISIFA